MKNAAAIASLSLLVVLGLGGVFNLASLALDPPQPEYYGSGYVAGLWSGAVFFSLAGALAFLRLLTRPGAGPKTFTVAQTGPPTFTPGDRSAATPLPELVRPDVKAFFLGRR